MTPFLLSATQTVKKVRVLPITAEMPVCFEECNAACQAQRLEIGPKEKVLHDEFDASNGKSKDDIMDTASSAPFIGRKHSYPLPPFNPLLLQQPKIEPLQMSSLQTKFIVKTMNELRYSNASKRRKMETEHGENYDHDIDGTFSSFRGGNCASDDDSITSLCRSDSSLLDIFDELEAHPSVIQLIASSGGLITHWNEAFAEYTHKSSASLNTNPITMFELIDSKSLPALYSMLAMSLHNVPIVEVEVFSPIDKKNASFDSFEEEGVLLDVDLAKMPRPSSSSSHLSITLPCKSFHGSSTRCNITIVFVDADSMKRCFLGVVTPCGTSSKQEGSRNGDFDYENSGNFGPTISPGAPSDNLTPHVHNISGDREDYVRQRVKSMRREHGADSSATPLPQIPSGKLLRIDDKLLCRILFDSKWVALR